MEILDSNLLVVATTANPPRRQEARKDCKDRINVRKESIDEDAVSKICTSNNMKI